MINKFDNQASRPTTEETPTLKISNTIFPFNDLRVGSTIADTFTISNAGGGVLNGSIKTNKKWLKVFQSDIDTTQKKQDVPFQVNTSGLAFGLKDTGTIEIKSNAGIEKVNVTISVEAETIALLRKEINIPVIAGIGVLGVAIAVTVIAWQMALKTEKDAKLYTSKTKQEQMNRQAKYDKHPTVPQNTSISVQSPLPQKGTQESIIKEQIVYLSDIEPTFVNVGWGKFESYIGLWDSGNQHREILGDYDKNNEGSVVFQVWLDGEKKYESGILKWKNTEHINISVEGVEKMELVVDPTFDGNRYDWSVCGEAKLVCSETKESVEQSTVQSPLTVNISGEWEGKVNNKPAKLSIVQDGNKLKGNIDCNNVKEFLSGEINNDSIVLRGTYFFAKKGTGFSLDTFSGTISSQDGDFIRGNYTDEDGNSGEWFVKRVLVTSSPASQQINPQNTELTNGDIQLSGEWEGKVDNRPVKLSIAQDGNSLSGNIVYDTEFSKTNVKEHLSGEINNDKIVLKGTGYTTKGVTSFSLDTFSGTISSKDGDFIRGNYTDETGHSGEWFVKRKSTMFTQESMPDQSKNQDNYKPETAIQSSQAKLTKAMQKTPGFQIKHKRDNYPNSKMYSTVDDAKVKFLDNDSLEIRIKVDRVTINCTWSPKDYAYVGTWRRDILEHGPVSKLLLEKRHDDRRMQGKIKLFPRFNSNNEIMCFYGYIMSYNAYIGLIHTWSYGNDYPGTPIKIAPTFWCLCPDPEGD